MRATPTHVAKALQDYEPTLGLVWNQADGCWWFTIGGREAWVYRHRQSGKLLAGDPTVGEAMEIVRAADTRVRGTSMFDGMKRHREKLAARYDREKARLLEDATAEFRRRARTAEHGPQPWVGPQA